MTTTLSTTGTTTEPSSGGSNGAVRLDAMLALAERLGCEALATGHYARVAEADHPSGPLLRVAAEVPGAEETLEALAPG